MPIVFIEGKAYVGGMRVDRNEARFVDYLYSAESSREAVLVEIKTPETKLLGSKYRGVFAPSSELAGAIIQVMDYRAELIQNYKDVTRGTKHEISIFNPRCVIIAGKGNQQLTSEERRRSFEMFRAGLKDIEVITYDELFRKVEVLGALFGLIRKK